MSTTALKAQVGQTGQNTRNELLQLKISHTHFYNEPVDMMKRQDNIAEGILVTTESYMIITNMFKTINLQKQ